MSNHNWTFHHDNQAEMKAVNEAIFDEVLTEVMSKIDLAYQFDNNLASATTKVRGIKESLYQTKYNQVFFEILAKYDYNMRTEIIDTVHYLSNLKNPNQNSEVIKRMLASPVIQDICFDGKSKFTITSEQYGQFIFELASYYFRKNQTVTDHMKKYPLAGGCHDHTYLLSRVLEDYYAVTSMARYFFKGGYYHSYSLNPNEMLVIDLSCNAIVPAKNYYNIFQPQEISAIPNRQVDEQINYVNFASEQPFERADLLKIALYKQVIKQYGKPPLNQKVKIL